MQPPVAIDLPLPTSANRMWRKGRGRVFLNPAYKSWINQANRIFYTKDNRSRTPIAGRFTAKIYVRDGIRLDPDNTIKPLLDWAQRAGVIADDKHLRSLTLSYGDIGNDCRLVIEELA